MDNDRHNRMQLVARTGAPPLAGSHQRPAAVKSVCKKLPVKVKSKDSDIFVNAKKTNF